jgi:hypothetical protein
MKLIIDIPDNEYRHIKEYYEKNDIVEAIYSYIIYRGTPLDEPFINKSCISEGVCHEDKVKVLDKIRAEIDGIEINGQVDEHTSFVRTGDHVKQMALEIIDKYRKGDTE